MKCLYPRIDEPEGEQQQFALEILSSCPMVKNNSSVLLERRQGSQTTDHRVAQKVDVDLFGPILETGTLKATMF
jgi:hypothetical protein